MYLSSGCTKALFKWLGDKSMSEGSPVNNVNE